MSSPTLIHVLYLTASILFILAMVGLGRADTARRGIRMAELGMLLAVIGTLLNHRVITYEWIIVGLLIGSLIGTIMALKIPMTKMPERIALSHAFGGLAVTLVGVNEYYGVFTLGLHDGHMDTLSITAIGAEVAFGGLTFTGSLVAFAKLQGLLPGRPLTFRGQNAINVITIVGLVAAVGYLIYQPGTQPLFYAVMAIGLLLGFTLVMPIGGADMPVVICLLNSYAGLAAAATGFALGNNVLIICGALDGGSGFILGMVMSRAMNRSFTNVLFGAFGATRASGAADAGAAVGPAPNEGSLEEAAEVLGSAGSVIVVPGYGMAVSQAQYAVRDLANVLKTQGVTVRYAIHPVAGRMPGHMNVLLAEANVPYDDLFELDDINDDFEQTDVALVVGANDVVNPAANEDPSSPIHGMPVFHCARARTCIVLKRSLNPGFAGIENKLFIKPNTMMVLGDAKKTLSSLVGQLKG
jgi:H+-translocating NAD(P) transhydrogenase subunit beta